MKRGRSFRPAAGSQGTVLRRVPSWLLWIAGLIAALLLLLFVAAFFIDAPLRRAMEQKMNTSLDGYSVRIAAVDFHPVGLSITVLDLVLIQDAHPDPPVATFPRIDASVHWRELFTGHLVSDWRIQKPALHVNLQQLQEEDEDEVPVEKRGWQEAVQHIYPLKINRLTIREGEFTYIDEDPEHPLRLTAVNLTAANIRNIRSPERTYPSPFHLEAAVFEQGHGTVEGEADFLAQPQPAIRAVIRLQEVPLERLRPVTARANIHVSGGIVSGAGRIEYAPKVKTAHLEELTVDGLKVDYVHSAVTAEAEKERARKAGEAAGKAVERPDLVFRIDRLRLTNSDLGFVNESEDPDYRIFLSQVELRLQNLSSQFREGEAEARIRGKFMGAGDFLTTAAFRPEEDGSDFDLTVEIKGTPATRLNDLLRAHTGLDVVAGSFALYSELSVRGRQIDGYVKPFFRDLDIYDPRQEKGEGILRQIKEGVAGALAKILENPREEVATRFDLSGTVEDPEASTLQILLQMIKNGFFDAILPGFERESGGPSDGSEN